MTRVEREQLIARYLGGEFTTAEEQDFFIRVAVDKDLRQDLRAQRTVDSALTKDRDAQATGHSGMRVRVASVLAATPAGPASVPPHAIPSGAAAASGSAALPNATGVAGAIAMKWLAIGAACAVLGAAIVLVPDLLRDDPSVPEPPSNTSQSSDAQHLEPTRPIHPQRDGSRIPGDSSRSASRDVQLSSSRNVERADARVPDRASALPESPNRATTNDRSSTSDGTDATDEAYDGGKSIEEIDRAERARLDDSIHIGIKLSGSEK